jgi:hypothetical protein
MVPLKSGLHRILACMLRIHTDSLACSLEQHGIFGWCMASWAKQKKHAPSRHRQPVVVRCLTLHCVYAAALSLQCV